MKRRRNGLLNFTGVARRLGKSLSYTYWLSSMDPAFPPVEEQEGTRKLFACHTVDYYKRTVRRGRWYRARH